MNVINTWQEIPEFESEETEALFWSENRLDVRLRNASLLKGDARESITVTLRFDPRMLARIKRLARARCLIFPVRWHDVTEILVGMGVSLFVEPNPGRVLSNLTAAAFPEIRSLATCANPLAYVRDQVKEARARDC